MKTQLSKPARTKARYSEEYKQKALELWRASGRNAAKVAAELGIRPPLLYHWAHAQHGLVPSMSRKGNCYDNAFIESFFSSLKYELVYHQRFATHAQARTAIFDYIETFYNRTRLHSSLDYQSPINFESQPN